MTAAALSTDGEKRPTQDGQVRGESEESYSTSSDIPRSVQFRDRHLRSRFDLQHRGFQDLPPPRGGLPATPRDLRPPSSRKPAVDGRRDGEFLAITPEKLRIGEMFLIPSKSLWSI